MQTRRVHKSRLFLFSFLTFLFLSFSINQAEKTNAATQGYRFDFGSLDVPSGGEIELKTLNDMLSVEPIESTEGLSVTATVAFYSSEESVVTCEDSGIQGRTKLVRKGPGYSTITAVVTDNGVNFSISCLVKVELQITGEGFITIDYSEHRALQFDQVGQKKPIILRYVSFEDIPNTLVDWSSSNEQVATVDNLGNVTAVGAGMTEIVVTTQTVSGQSKALQKKATVIVAPIGSFTESAAPQYTGYKNRISLETSQDHFMLYINGASATNLVWKVYQVVTTGGRPKETELKADGPLLNYAVNEYSGSTNFSNVKAGTYVVRAFVSKDVVGNAKIPYFEAKVVVLFSLQNKNLIMNVGDSYDIIKNSNIPNQQLFSFVSSNSNIAAVDPTTGVITAKNSSQTPVRITMTYKNLGVFESGGDGAYQSGVPDLSIDITVIDGIRLNYSEVTINTKGSILIEPIVTNRLEDVTWSSSDAKIVSVSNGLVTGLKEGTAIITASQVIDGIIKKASCTVYVQTSVTKVSLDPPVLSLGIGRYATIQATITPASLSGVSLKWVSSDEKVVKITEAGKLSVTIQGVAGGTAVISAINQDNVVVGFCTVTVIQPVTGLTLSETDILARIKDTVQLRATAAPVNATNQEVTWKSSNTSVATVSANGLVTMKAAGTASIICTSKDSPSVQAFCYVTVQKPVSGISFDIESREMYVGETYRLTYMISPIDASTTAVTFTSTNGAVVQVDATGMLTAKGVGQSEIMIKTVDGSFLDLCTIVVKQKPTGVKLSVSNLTMNAGEYFYLDVVLTPANSSKEGLVYECVDTKVATVSSTGRVTAKEAGTTIIMVKTENGATSYCTLRVLQAVMGLEITPGKVLIDAGERVSLSTEFTPASASNTSVLWESSDESIATVNKDGEVTGVSGGLAVVTCQTDDGGYRAFCIVTVNEQVTGITITPEQVKLGLQRTYQLKAEIVNSGASNKEVEWTSSDESIVSVDQKGKIKGLALGYATITAMALDGSDAEASCEIRVVNEVTSMTINKTSVTLVQGETFPLVVTIRPDNATYATCSFESEDEKIALVDDDGVVTALSPGFVWITARARDGSGKYCKCYVNVIAQIPATSVTTMMDEIVMAPGEKKTVLAKTTPVNTTDEMTWTSTDESVVRVNQKTGEITAVAPGTTEVIVMTDSGRKAVITVIVVGLNRTSVVMDFYSGGERLYVEGATQTIRWYSSNRKVVEVSANGTLTSRGTGKATIEARVNGRTLTCRVTVVSP